MSHSASTIKVLLAHLKHCMAVYILKSVSTIELVNLNKNVN